MHGRNADWAEKAVREAVSLSYEAALREHVIDVVADDLPDLLHAADGRMVVAGGRTVRLATADADLREVVPDWRDRLLATLTDPSILYVMLLAGVAGIVFEFTHPGVFAPGVLGTICLVLAGYGLNLLPIDYAGAALALFGIGLMVAEGFVPAFGAFVLGGGGAFLIGSLMMFQDPVFRPSVGMIVVATLASAAVFGLVLEQLVRSRHVPGASGDAALFGASGRVAQLARQRGPGARFGRILERPRLRRAGGRRGGAGDRAARPAPFRGSDVNRAAPAVAQEDRMGIGAVENLAGLLLAVALPFSSRPRSRIMREYQRAVMFTLGRFTGVKGPGLVFVIPFVAADRAGRSAHPGA